jgi:hypothetical protein
MVLDRITVIMFLPLPLVLSCKETMLPVHREPRPGATQELRHQLRFRSGGVHLR